MIIPEKFSAIFYPSVADIDLNYKHKPSFILNCFQIIAEEHAMLLNAGYEYMKSNYNVYWVLSRIFVEIYKYPKYTEKLKFTTWPLEPKPVECIREYIIEQEDGEVIGKGKAMLLILDADTHKLKPVKSINMAAPEKFKEEMLNKCRLDKILPEKLSEPVYDTQIRISDIDINKHVNNAKYADYMFNAFSSCDFENFEILSFQINYLNEAKEGDKIYITKYNAGNNIYIIEGKTEDKNIFISKVSLRVII